MVIQYSKLLAWAIIATSTLACNVQISCSLNGKDCNSNAALTKEQSCFVGLLLTVTFQNTRSSAITLSSVVVNSKVNDPFDITQISGSGFGTVAAGQTASYQQTVGPVTICGADPPLYAMTVQATGSNGCSASAAYNWDISKKCLPTGADCLIFDEFCCSNKCLGPQQGCKAAASGGFGCFSGESNVDVENQGTISMKDLTIGDRVMNARGVFDRVYSFSHYAPQDMVNFLQLHLSQGTTIEMTPEHMVFRHDGMAVPASMLSVGDKVQLLDGEAEVKDIRSIVKKGAFAPFTESGTIAVNNVLASSFVSMQKDSEVLMVGGARTPFSMQWISQLFLSPHRLICWLHFDRCRSETYSDDGISTYIDAPYRLAQWFMEQSSALKLFLGIPALLAFGAIGGAEYIMRFGWASAFFTVSVICILTSKRQVKKQI